MERDYEWFVCFNRFCFDFVDQRLRWAYLKYLKQELDITKYDQWQEVTNEKLEQKKNLTLPPAWRLVVITISKLI